MPHNRNPNRVLILRVDHDAGDVVTLRQSHELPGLSGVGRLEHAGARVAGSLIIGFAGTHPNRVAIFRERKIAYAEARLVFPNRRPALALIFGSEKAAGRKANVDLVWLRLWRRDHHDAPTLAFGSDVSPVQPTKRRVGFHRQTLCIRGVTLGRGHALDRFTVEFCPFPRFVVRL